MTSHGPASYNSIARIVVKAIFRTRVITFFTLVAVASMFDLTANAETLRFAWPDGASAKVQTRSYGRRAIENDDTRIWDMSADFTMRIKRTGDRIVISRDGFSGWKGTFPPSFGGGAERFVGHRRCAQFRSETGADQKQVKKILESLLQKACAGQPKLTVFDQGFKVDIIVEKKTMLPQQLTITRLHTFDFEMGGRSEGVSEEITKTYTFAWTVPEN